MDSLHPPLHTHIILPHTPVTRGVHGCVVLVSQQSTTCCCCLASPINTGGRKWTTHHPSFSHLWANYTHPIDMYSSTEQYIPSAPTHHSPQCVWTLQTVCTEVLVIWRAGMCSMAALQGGERQNVCDRSCEWRDVPTCWQLPQSCIAILTTWEHILWQRNMIQQCKSSLPIVQHYWSERGKREEGRRQLSYLWVFREPHWGNLHNEIQVIIHMICSCQDTPTLPAPCCVPQWNCSHSDCSLHPISEVKQAQILPCSETAVQFSVVLV